MQADARTLDTQTTQRAPNLLLIREIRVFRVIRALSAFEDAHPACYLIAIASAAP